MSSGEVTAKTVGYIVTDGDGLRAGTHQEDGSAWFCAKPETVYSTINAALMAVHKRAQRLGYLDAGITLARVVERTISQTERSYEAL